MCLCTHQSWETAYWRHLATFDPPHSHLGLHWSAGGAPPCLLPYVGNQWWRLPSGPPAELRSGSRPRRPQGFPALWTWCRTRWTPGLAHEAARWLDWTTQTAAPVAAVCQRRHRCVVPPHAPGIQPGRAGGCLIIVEGSSDGKGRWKTQSHEGSKKMMVVRWWQSKEQGGGKRKKKTAVKVGKGYGRSENMSEWIVTDRKEGVSIKLKQREEKEEHEIIIKRCFIQFFYIKQILRVENSNHK